MASDPGLKVGAEGVKGSLAATREALSYIPGADVARAHRTAEAGLSTGRILHPRVRVQGFCRCFSGN